MLPGRKMSAGKLMAAAKNVPHGIIRSFADQNVVLDEFHYAPELILAVKRNLFRLIYYNLYL